MLGKFPLPVEVIPFAQALLAKKITALGASVRLRVNSSRKPFITDEGHHILDCHFGQISDPDGLARELERMPGIVEHGLFIGMTDALLVGKGDTALELQRAKE
jgi:ribose 5-phosphate isomerase A